MAIAFINSTALTIGTAASTWSIPVNSSIEGGAAFFVGLGPASSAVTVNAVTDNAGNVYAEAIEHSTSARTVSAALWYATNISSLSTRVSVTLSGNSSGSLAVGQFRGVSTGNALVGVLSAAITAISTTHGVGDLFIPGNGLGITYARTNASSMSPVAFDGNDAHVAWTSTGNAVRQVGGYRILGAGSTTRDGRWYSGSGAGSSGAVQHTMVYAAFSDTATPPPFYYNSFGLSLMGVQ